jgi:hypothetical protein
VRKLPAETRRAGIIARDTTAGCAG